MVHAQDSHQADGQWPVLDALVDRVLDARRQIAAAQAAEAQLLAEAVTIIADRTDTLRQHASQAGRTYTSTGDLPLREVSLELGAAMRVSDRTVQARISDAHALTTDFPATFAALSTGQIDAGHAWAIVRSGIGLTDEVRSRYERLALDAAATESTTRTAQAAKAIAAALCPEAFADRASAAADERDVRLYDLDEGMVRLIADLPAPLGQAIYDLLTSQARAVLATDQTPDSPIDPADGGAGPDLAGDSAGLDPAEDPHADTLRLETGPRAAAEPRTGATDARTLAQVRADLFCELLLTGIPSSCGDDDLFAHITAQIQVTVPALTLAGDPSGRPASLTGHGPIDPDIARRLAGLAPGWDRVFTDPCSGEVLAVNRYRPSAQIKRYLAARDERCRAPACTRPVHRCDCDHTVAAADGGPTEVENLAHFCRRHHTDKHQTAWRVRQLGRGVIEWIGPTGRRYADRPPAVVRFVPLIDDSPPPF